MEDAMRICVFVAVVILTACGAPRFDNKHVVVANLPRPAATCDLPGALRYDEATVKTARIGPVPAEIELALCAFWEMEGLTRVNRGQVCKNNFQLNVKVCLPRRLNRDFIKHPHTWLVCHAHYADARHDRPWYFCRDRDRQLSYTPRARSAHRAVYGPPMRWQLHKLEREQRPILPGASTPEYVPTPYGSTYYGSVPHRRYRGERTCVQPLTPGIPCPVNQWPPAPDAVPGW